MKKTIVKVHAIEFDHEPECCQAAIEETTELLEEKGYIFDGIFISVDTKIAYVWKNIKPKKPSTPVTPSIHA